MKLVILDLDTLCIDMRMMDWDAYVRALKIVDSKTAVNRDVAMRPYTSRHILPDNKAEFVERLCNDMVCKLANELLSSLDCSEFIDSLRPAGTKMIVVASYAWPCIRNALLALQIIQDVDYICSMQDFRTARDCVAHCISRCDVPNRDVHCYFTRSDLRCAATMMSLTNHDDGPAHRVICISPKIVYVWNAIEEDVQTIEGNMWYIAHRCNEAGVRLLLILTEAQHSALAGTIARIEHFEHVSAHRCERNLCEILHTCRDGLREQHRNLPCMFANGVDQLRDIDDWTLYLRTVAVPADAIVYRTPQKPGFYAAIEPNGDVRFTNDFQSMQHMEGMADRVTWMRWQTFYSFVTEDTRTLSELINVCIKNRKRVVSA